MRASAAAVLSVVLVMHALTGAPSPGPQFRNVAAQSGIDFVLENSPTARKHLPETMAGGVAVFDYDADGWPDIFFTNGAAMPSLRKEGPRHHNRLYRNERNGKFRDVTAEAGLAGEGYSIAAAAADFDNDGRVDLFVGGVRLNRLYRNLGGGRFRDVTAVAGIASGLWCEGAAWFDYDNDGRLDLFVVNYLQWTPEFDTWCGDAERKIRAYCHPRFFEGLPNTLYRNRGDGTFDDVSRKSGIAAHVGKGMSAAAADYDNDGFPDLYVTNDKLPNFLFHNKRDGTFEEVALLAGGALQDSGMAASAMGVDFRDYNNDGSPDVVFTALAGETFPLFVNTAKAELRDAGHLSGLAKLSHTRSGWGVGVFDFDNDGWKDVFSANAHVNDTVESFEAAQYKLTNSVFANTAGKFRDATAASGFGREPPRAHRGAAFADFNNDGRIDIVVSALGEGPELWENTTPGANRWLIVRPIGRKSNRDGIGARVRIDNQQNHMTSAVGYVSSSHFGIHFGLGTIEKIERMEVRWPSGATQVLANVTTNRVLAVEEP